jgi:hypothetical protein
MIRQLALACIALLAVNADGKECKGVVFPEHVEAHGTNLSLNGVGLRTATVFSVSVYVAALYVVKPTTDPRAILDSNTPVQISLHFVRGLSARQIRDAWAEGLSKEGNAQQLAALKDRLDQLDRWTDDVKSGQRLTFTRLPGEGLTFEVDGTMKGTLPGDDFARAFLLIWLGSHPPTLEVKSGLLGGACG